MKHPRPFPAVCNMYPCYHHHATEKWWWISDSSKPWLISAHFSARDDSGNGAIVTTQASSVHPSVRTMGLSEIVATLYEKAAFHHISTPLTSSQNHFYFLLLALLDYVSRAHEIENPPSSVVRPSVVRPSVASIISEVIAWISFKFWL